jgi:hypothetical protein
MMSMEETPLPTWEDEEPVHEAVFITACSRYPEGFRQQLLRESALESCRTAMEEAGVPCELPSGCKLFCSPAQYPAICTVTEHFKDLLRPYHVLSSERYHGTVLKTIHNMPRSLKIRVKSDFVYAYITDSDGTDTDASSCGTGSDVWQ